MKKNSDLKFDSSLQYERHQRDYSILGSSIVFRGLFNQNVKFFSTTPSPIYIIVKNKIFYHYLAKWDGILRMKKWLRNNDINLFKKIDKFYLSRLKEFNKFEETEENDLILALKKSYDFFIDFTEIIFLGYELPLYMENKVTKEMLDFALDVRRRYEDIHKRSFSIQDKLLKKLEKAQKIKKDTLRYLTIDEFEIFLKNGDLPNIENRKKFVIIKYDGKYSFFYEPKLWRVLNPKGSTDFVKGNIAFKGIVTGRVKVITKIEEINKLKKGDVLVTSMTDPRYVAAMKKACAIVTDEGGITCHASIVAREMKKPCVISTKMATHTFKDGDMVEVDAEHGIVKKINQRGPERPRDKSRGSRRANNGIIKKI